MKSRLLLFFLIVISAFLSPVSLFAQNKKSALMWFDGEANFARFSHPDSIDYYLKKCHDLGFTDVVVDVRPITGEVFFKSSHAPMMKDWKGVARPDFDYLGRFIQTAHQLGMRVQASLNCFVAGHNYFNRGLIYSHHPEWATIVYTPQGLKSITEQKEKYSAMVDPMNEAFRKHIIGVLQDLVSEYPHLDGIILDRVRYDGIEADFSNHSRKLFEKYVGQQVKHFPEDIFTWKKGNDGKYHVSQGHWFKQWITWRAQNIHDAMVELRKSVKALNPHISFGTYTGAWYPSYYEVGVNFASNTYDPSVDYDWATKQYKKTGYMECLDLYTTGNYYTDITIDDYQHNKHSVWNETDSEAQTGSWYCVEGSCKKLRGILGGHPFIGGLLVDQLYKEPQKLSQSIEMNLKESDGVMLFDIVHLINRPELWKEVEIGMKKGGMIP
ncbi:MAG: family 10 glycosylhydrolase [Prevotella sp.]|jgi:uncharacterized lipoprotein YddW (UPF0748 family)|nr:family 10 glycosylhydrolase [Prevotella sp.]MCI1282038.1 family 10 glycosylhydrolase [Prevotella sp.]